MRWCYSKFRYGGTDNARALKVILLIVQQNDLEIHLYKKTVNQQQQPFMHRNVLANSDPVLTTFMLLSILPITVFHFMYSPFYGAYTMFKGWVL